MKKIFETPEINVRELAVENGVMNNAMVVSNNVDTASIVYVEDTTNYAVEYNKWKGFGA